MNRCASSGTLLTGRGGPDQTRQSNMWAGMDETQRWSPIPASSISAAFRQACRTAISVCIQIHNFTWAIIPSHVYIKCKLFGLESKLGIDNPRCFRLYLRDLCCLPIELKINWIGYRICSSCTLPCVKKHPKAKPHHCISHSDTSSNLDKTWSQQNAATHSIFKAKDSEHIQCFLWLNNNDWRCLAWEGPLPHHVQEAAQTHHFMLDATCKTKTHPNKLRFKK